MRAYNPHRAFHSDVNDRYQVKSGRILNMMKAINIYVGNLSFNVTEEQLRQKFMDFGEVVSVTIMNDKYIGSGQPLGYGFVEMDSRREGEAAIASLHGTIMGGQMIDVIEALPLTEKGDKKPLFNNKGRQLKRQKRERKY
jgi:RNA recognition motif-containing protein